MNEKKDIVARLREFQEFGVFTARHRYDLVGEAAAEIEKLREALATREHR